VASVPQKLTTPTLGADDLVALRSSVAHFDREQLIWSSGFLAGMAGSTAPHSAVSESLPATDSETAAASWQIFYASETGNSRRIAEQLLSTVGLRGMSAELHDLAITRPKALKNVRNAIFVLATHGIGEPPEGSETFFEFWFGDKAPCLEQLNYSVLALGDSSYADFCETGRRFDERLTQLGAVPVVDRVDCDLDFETPAHNWTEQIIQYTDAKVAISPRRAHLSAVPSAPLYTRKSPYVSEIQLRQLITGRGSSKRVAHIELDLEDSGIVYQPGDSLAVVASNPPQLVTQIALATGLAEADVEAKEISALSRPILDAVAASHPALKAVLNDREQFSQFLVTRQLIDLINEFPVDWQDPKFLQALRSLTPRSYSIASSPDANPDEAHLTVAVVAYEKFDRPHWGAASNFLIGDATHAPIYLEANDNFRLPADSDAPIIMVGAGTGVAPYRAFVEHRREHGHRGDNWLVFGDRNLNSDFLYQLEWLRYRREGLLSNLDVAFSRDQENKVYVQDRLLEKGADIFAWLERGAHFYVCGDAQHMAIDVHAALLSIVQRHGGQSVDSAVEYVKQLQKDRRYQRDVY
jgi:sulfite reductase (NADPH) flavoprotein alpha-component